jgi:hypothetical protein
MVKFVGPSKKMDKALEEAGLNITWPKAKCKEEDLAIEASFYTGPGDWEKLVTIDLRPHNEYDLSTKGSVDLAVRNELVKAYTCFDIEDELALNMEGTAEERERRGVPCPETLLEDLKEQEKMLEYFSDVASAVINGTKIPRLTLIEEVTLSVSDAKVAYDGLRDLRFAMGSRVTTDEVGDIRRVYNAIGNQLPIELQAGFDTPPTKKPSSRVG